LCDFHALIGFNNNSKFYLWCIAFIFYKGLYSDFDKEGHHTISFVI